MANNKVYSRAEMQEAGIVGVLLPNLGRSC